MCPAAGAGNDYQKDIQFRKLNAKKDELKIKVVRDAKELLIPNTDLVVGDLVLLVTGDKIVADGLCVESHGLVADEASLTGESDPLKKGPEDPFCRAGTQVSNGMGAGPLVQLAAVGRTLWGGRSPGMLARSNDMTWATHRLIGSPMQNTGGRASPQGAWLAALQCSVHPPATLCKRRFWPCKPVLRLSCVSMRHLPPFDLRPSTQHLQRVLQGPQIGTSVLQVSEGSGSMVVIAVGLNSEYGKTMSLVMTEAEDTPLQETLAVLAAAIGKFGLFVAVVCFCVLLIR